MKIPVANCQARLDAAHEALAEFARENGIGRDAAWKLGLALEEMLGNIVQYAWQDAAAHEIQLDFSLSGRVLNIRIADDGQPFNPLDQPHPDTTLPLDEKPLGGLGVFMARQSVDEIEYRREGALNVLTLAKRV